MAVGIIGGGPAGCFFASKLKWSEPIIFEEDKSIGDPIKCTGIVTEGIEKLIKIPDYLIVNKIDTFEVEAPNGKSISFPMTHKDIILHRGNFDKYVGQLAIDNGAKILLNHKFSNLKFKRNEHRKSKRYSYEDSLNLSFETPSGQESHNFDYLVGADGPYSSVNKLSGMNSKYTQSILSGYQARVRYKSESVNTTKVLLGKGEFAWIVPEDEHIARIGLVGRTENKNVLFKQFQDLCGKKDGKKILEYQSGSIPLYNPKRTIQKNNLALIGDAAGQVKASTYGGIIYALTGGKLLGKKWNDYESRFNSELGRDLKLSLKIRKILNNFSDNEFNDLLNILSTEKNKEIIGTSDRNYPSRFAARLALRNPALWKFLFKLF